MRIFIHNVDTHLGKVLVEELRRADGGFHRVFGTVAKSADKAPKVVKRIVSRNDPKQSKKMIATIESCKLVVIDLFSCTLEDLHFAIKALKVDPTVSPPKPTGELENDVTFVLVSSAMVWANTKVDNDDGIVRESDYLQRAPRPGSKYEQWLEMENLVLSCFNREESRVKALIVAGGVLYGEGENSLMPLFKDAWCGKQEHVILGNGKNRIPTVHVRDLARLCRQIGDNAEINAAETPYFLAVDQPATEPEGSPALPPTQAELVQGIVDEICDPYEVPLVQEDQWQPAAGDDEEADAALESLREALTLDLVLAPSKHMLEPEFAAISNPPGWCCREGLLKNIRKIAEQFCKERKLRAMRVLIGGPPASGKTTLAGLVSEHFRIPKIELDPAAESDKMVETLSSRVCRYRGFVLDAGVAGFAEMEKLFRYALEVPPADAEGEEAEADDEAKDDEEGRSGSTVQVTRALHEEIIPSFVVITQAPRGLCHGRWMQSRGDEDLFKQTWLQYKNNNLSEMNLSEFFQEICKTSVFTIPIAGKDEEDVFESTRIYMEREGRPFNYLPSGDEVAEQILARIAEKEQEEAEARAAEQGAQGEGGASAQGESQRQARRLQIVDRHEREQEKLHELSLREYLMQYMIPSLTEGLIEVCKVLPENPAEYLADVLEERAGEVSGSSRPQK